MICCMAIWVGVYGAKLEVPPEGTDLEAGGEAGTDGGGGKSTDTWVQYSHSDPILCFETS